MTALGRSLLAELEPADVAAMRPDTLEALRQLLAGHEAQGSEGDRWLDTREAAAHLGVHVDTVRKLATAGTLPSEQEGPRCKRYFQVSELDRWRATGGARGHLQRLP